ncbi:MAG: hypothetical protein ACT4PP_14565 [Sporichthyaceae bacterium]
MGARFDIDGKATTMRFQRRRYRLATTVLGAALAATALTACGDDDDSTGAAAPVQVEKVSASLNAEKVADLRGTMHDLWADHMQYTIMTVKAFFHDEAAVQPNLDRLLKNQTDMGAAFGSYFGPEVGDKVTALLTTHIQQAVPVLKAAQADDQKALKKALDDWYVNADEIAGAITSLSPEIFPEQCLKPVDRPTGRGA